MATLGPIVAAFPLNSLDGSRLVFTADTDGEIRSRALNDTPSNFETMDSPLNIRVVWRSNASDDTLIVRARIVNGATILAAADAGGSFQEVGRITGNNGFADIDQNVDFGFVNTTADKATWDGANLEIQQGVSRSMAADNCQIQPDLAEISGTYTEAMAAIAVGGSIAPAGSLKFAGLRELRNGRPPYFGGEIVRAANGALYAVNPQASDDRNHRFVLHKSDDNGASWDELHIFAMPGQHDLSVNEGAVVARLEGDILHCGFISNEASIPENRLYYAAWDTATDTVEATAELVSAKDYSPTVISIAIRSTQEVCLIAQRNSDDIHEIWRGTAGAWNLHDAISEISFGAPTDAYLATNPDNNDIHIIWATFSANDPTVHRVLHGADNTLSANQSLGVGSGSSLRGPYTEMKIFDNALFFPSPTTSVNPTVYRGSPLGDTPTFATQEVHNAQMDRNGSEHGVHLGRAGGRLIATWVDEADQQIRWSGYNRGTDTWDPPTNTGITVVEGGGIVGDAYVRAGDVYLGIGRMFDSYTGAHPESRPYARVFHEELIGPEVILGPSIQTAGTVTPAGSLARHTTKLLAGSAPSTGAITRQTVKAFAGAITPTGTLASIRGVLQTLTGAITPVGALIRQAALAHTGTATPTGTTTKATTKTHTGTATPAGNLIKTAARTLAGVAPSTGALVGKALKDLAGTITPTGDSTHDTLIGTIRRTFTGTINAVGTLLLHTATTKTGATTPAGSLTKATSQTHTGTLTPTGSIATMIKSIIQLAGTITPTGTLTRATTQTLAGAIAPAAELAGKTLKTIAGTITPTGASTHDTLTGTILRSFAGAIAATGDLALRVAHRLEGTATPAGSYGPTTVRTTQTGTATPAGAVTTARTAILALSGTISALTGTLSRRIRARYASTVTPAGLRRLSIAKTLTGAITPTARHQRATRLVLSGAITMTSSIATQIFNVLAAPISRLIRGHGRARGIHHQGDTR